MLFISIVLHFLPSQGVYLKEYVWYSGICTVKLVNDWHFPRNDYIVHVITRVAITEGESRKVQKSKGVLKLPSVGL